MFVLTPPFPCHVTLTKLYNFSKSRFTHLQNIINVIAINYYSRNASKIQTLLSKNL